MSKYSIGLDFGTNSVRALVVDVSDGKEIATSVWDYQRGEAGIIVDSRNPHLARQHPADYVEGIEACITHALKEAADVDGFSAKYVIGIGVDTTGSTPMPVDKEGEPLAFSDKFGDNPAAMAWLWKDHTGFAEAGKITEQAEKTRPQFLAKCGGTYSSEWFWSKIWHCMKVAPDVFEAAYTWVEIADWIPAVLTGTTHPERVKRGICAAGHKAMFHSSWGGYPDAEFLSSLEPKLAQVRKTLPDKAFTVADAAGGLTDEWAEKLGLPAGIPVAVGAFDAHLGGVGSGIQENVLVKIMGTSTCDMMVTSLDKDLPDIPGLCGIVPESILPGYYGLEAGQSAVGDIFNWFVSRIQPGGEDKGTHEVLTEQAAKIKPGESGLLGLDWHNGNRTVLVDQRLTGMLLGMTLHTSPAEIYRALIESTAFGARVIMERFEEYGLKVERVLTCGGIPGKSPMTMQIYADIMGRDIEIAKGSQTCALGAAMAGAVVAGKKAGGYDNFDDAVESMTGVLDTKYVPDPDSVKIYDELFGLYKQLHDTFGTREYSQNLHHVMKTLLNIHDQVVDETS
ncbi:ribulokinase [Candidatus Poribacteria bacterium]|nr:ribulokinase [Candidatus Poribacteria bacterium]